MSRSELNPSRWLEAHSDRSANLNVLPRSIALADISDDRDFRLVLADIKIGRDVRSRLKVYKGTLLISDQILPEVPSGVISFYMDYLEPKVPAIGVACGSELLIYKNNKPYFKFSTLSLPVDPTEKEAWSRLRETSKNLRNLTETLKGLPFNVLTPRSQKLLQLPASEIGDFISKYATAELTRNTTITCLSTLKKSTQDIRAPACPILGTEAGQIFILDPQSLSIIHQATTSTMKATPCFIETSGIFDVEYRIIIASREGYVTFLRRGWLEGKLLFQTTSHIVDMIFISSENFIMVATFDNHISCYTKKGNKVWSIPMTNSITCMCLVNLNHLHTSLLAVGLKGGYVHLFKGRQRVDYIQVSDTPSCVTFGQMGQEEHVMVIVTFSGAITFKILKRTADFNMLKQDDNSAPVLQAKPLPLPKRSKLFLEQSLRERQNAMDMHQRFQEDLLRLRLTVARALVQIQSDQTGIGNEKELIKLSAQVLGLGPKFTLILTLENMSSDKPLVGLSLLFHCKPTVYKLSTYVVMVPLIPPSLSYKIETKVEEVEIEQTEKSIADLNLTQVIRVFVQRKNQAQPVLAATINMPPTDLTAPLL